MSLRKQLEQAGKGLDKRRFGEADIEWMHYVAPLGTQGLHKVTPRGSTKQVKVSGPMRTFKPGLLVPVGSNTGLPGKTILQGNAAERGVGFPVPGSSEFPSIKPPSPLEIFGGSLEIWLDICVQGIGAGHGSPASFFADFSGNNNNGGSQGAVVSVEPFPVQQASWFFDGTDTAGHGIVGPMITFSIFMVVLVQAGADRKLAGGNSSSSKFVRWRNSDAKMQVNWGGGGLATSNIAYPSGIYLPFGFTRTSTDPNNPVQVFQLGGTEDLVTGGTGQDMRLDQLMHHQFLNKTPGNLRMFVVSSVPANALQRSQMATYMDFIVNGNWGL